MTPDPQATREQVNQGTRAHLQDIWLDHVNQGFAIERAAHAAGYGFAPRPYGRPFPGSPQQTTINVAGEPANARLRAISVAGLVAIAAMATCGGFGVAALLGLANRPTAVAPPAPGPSPTFHDTDTDTRYRFEIP